MIPVRLPTVDGWFGFNKSYLGAGLPIVLTNVPPNAEALRDSGCAVLVEDSPVSVASGIDGLLGRPELWTSMHRSALEEAVNFDWPVVLNAGLSALGFDVGFGVDRS